jgi:hypothetical protein
VSKNADAQFEELLLEIVQQTHTTHSIIVALVHMLIEKGILRGDEHQILEELEARSKDLQGEALNEVWVKKRAHMLREAWNKLPRQ